MRRERDCDALGLTNDQRACLTGFSGRAVRALAHLREAWCGAQRGYVMSELVFFGEREGGLAVVDYQLEGEEPTPRRRLPLPRLRTSGANLEARHSPNGFEWGYAGSGPAELARAILMRVYPGDEAVRHPRCYQRFKADVIAGLNHYRWRLTEAEVRAWRELFDASQRLSAPREQAG